VTLHIILKQTYIYYLINSNGTNEKFLKATFRLDSHYVNATDFGFCPGHAREDIHNTAPHNCKRHHSNIIHYE
jgi:hypothetical protein